MGIPELIHMQNILNKEGLLDILLIMSSTSLIKGVLLDMHG